MSLFSSNICNLESILRGPGNHGNSTSPVKWLSELKALRQEANPLSKPPLCYVDRGKPRAATAATQTLSPRTWEPRAATAAMANCQLQASKREKCESSSSLR